MQPGVGAQCHDANSTIRDRVIRAAPPATLTTTTMTDLSAEYKALAEYRPKHKVRFVTAASLFDGHDAAINIMRRIL